MDSMGLTSLLSMTHSKDRPLSNFWQTVIVACVAIVCLFIFWIVMWGATRFEPYSAYGVTLDKTIVCPLEAVTVHVDDELSTDTAFVNMDGGRVELRSSFVGVSGEPIYSELPFQLSIGHLRADVPTSFSRLAPDAPGEYIIRSRAIVKGTVAKFFLLRTSEFPIPETPTLTVKSPADTTCLPGPQPPI